MNRGRFTGLCYICGEFCGRTYCNEHKWCADYLPLPDRRDVDTAPATKARATARVLDELEAVRVAHGRTERILAAYRRMVNAA